MASFVVLQLCVLLTITTNPASSLLIEITPRDMIVLGAGGTEVREFICRLDSTDNPSNINGITSMTLYRHQANQKVILVRGEFSIQGLAYTYTKNPDLQSRATSIERIDKTNWEGSTVGFTIPVSALRCTDAGIYSCEMNVLPKPGQGPEGLVNSTQKELKVNALPNDATMIVTPYPSAGETGTINEPISASVDDVFSFECNSNIGSDQTTDITWQYTSELSGSFVLFPGNKTVGAVSGPADCQYRTSSKTFYTISSIDASRRTLLAIRCTVKVSLPYAVNGSTEYEIQNPPTLYFKVGAMNGGNTGEVASAGSGSAGAIAGGVIGGIAFIVIVVLLVYFLWYRKRGEGAAYRTKEERGAENPNMAPEPYPTTITEHHSQPAKKRGHENPTLDEPHESRRDHHERKDRHHKDHNRNDHRYDNTPGGGHGRANYGMDRDDEDYHSRDGSPSRNNIGHMGDDNASFGTGV